MTHDVLPTKHFMDPTIGWIFGTIWTADESPPMTATFLPFSATKSSQLALWSMGPLNISLPLMAGHFHLFSTPPALIKTLHLSRNELPEARSSTTLPR